MAKTTSTKKSKKSTSGVIEIDLNNVEVREAYDGDDPRPGFYTFELVNVRAHTSQGGNEGFAWLFALRDHPEYEGWVRTVYSNLDKDSTKWKTEEIMLALAGGNSVKGTKAAKVSLDVNDEASVKRFLKKAKLVRGRVQRERDSDDDDPQFGLGKIIALDEAKQAARAAAKAALEDDDDDAEDEDGEFDDPENEFEDDDEDDSDEDEDEDSDEEDDEDSDDDEEDDDEDEDLDDDEDEDDEEEEPEPPKKKAKAKATPAKATSKKASNVTPIKAAKGKKKK